MALQIQPSFCATLYRQSQPDIHPARPAITQTTTPVTPQAEHGEPSPADGSLASVRARRRQQDIDDGVRDAALVERIRSQDHQALGDLYDIHSGMVYSIALAIVRDSGRAEDVTQDVFLTLWRQADRFRPETGRFAPWFYRIARNRAIDVLRKHRREIMPDEPAVFDLMLGPSDDEPSETSLRLDEAARVKHALRLLPDDQRAVIELAYFEGLSHSKLAERLDLPLGTVKTRIRMGLRKLRDMLTADGARH